MAVYYPTLHDASNINTFYNGMDGSGLGELRDLLSGIVPTERNGDYTLEMTYPIEGVLADELKLGRVIMAMNSPTADHTQPFYINEISKDIQGNLTVKAEHISFYLRNIIAKPFTVTGTVATVAQTIITAVGWGISGGYPARYFTIDSDIDGNVTFTNESPTDARSLMLGNEKSLAYVLGGSFGVSVVFDRFNIFLTQNAGKDRSDFIVEYGYNMTDFTESDTMGSGIDGVLGYWKDSSDGTYYYSEVQMTPNYTTLAPSQFYRYDMIDCTDEFSSRPSTAQLNAATRRLRDKKYKGGIDVSFKVSFEEAAMSGAEIMPDLNDHITVNFPRYGITTSSYISGTVYNILTDRYDEITVGERQLTTYEILKR